jgi:hypothetical protein
MSMTLYPAKPAPGFAVEVHGHTIKATAIGFTVNTPAGGCLAVPSYPQALAIATDYLSSILAKLPDKARPQPRAGYRGDPREYPGYASFVDVLARLTLARLAEVEEEINRLKPLARTPNAADLAADAWTLIQWEHDGRNRAAKLRRAVAASV